MFFMYETEDYCVVGRHVPVAAVATSHVAARDGENRKDAVTTTQLTL